MTAQQVSIGTRGSALAVRQTELVAAALRERHPQVEFAIRRIESEGDRNQRDPVSLLGDKGVFVRALEQALLRGGIDLAVHSLKDVPSDVETPGLTLAAFSRREDPRDCVVSREGATLATLSSGARVGTSSLRRRAQLLAIRPDLTVVPIRGNVDTRLRKLRDREYDAIVLAAAGLHRLGLDEAITEYLSVDEMIPDAGQGILAIQARAGDPSCDLAACIDDPASRIAALAERAAVRALGADCRSPVGVLAALEGKTMRIRGMAASEDGSCLARAEASGPVSEAEATGYKLGRELLARLER